MRSRHWDWTHVLFAQLALIALVLVALQLFLPTGLFWLFVRILLVFVGLIAGRELARWWLTRGAYGKRRPPGRIDHG